MVFHSNCYDCLAKIFSLPPAKKNIIQQNHIHQSKLQKSNMKVLQHYQTVSIYEDIIIFTSN